MKKKLFLYSTIVAASLALLFFTTCTMNVANGGTEVGSPRISAMLYNSGGSPAIHAKVRFFPINYNPRVGGLTVDSTTTDAQGNYSAKLDTGTYNILASSDSGVAYQDSITVVKDSTVHPPADTLKAPGSIRGVIRLQPGDDARTVFIIFLGTNVLNMPEDAIGNFSVANMAEGTYRVRILTTLDAYLPKDTLLSFTAGKVDTLTHDIVLQYTGIPIPSGLKISYDTLKQIVTLTWNKPTTGRMVAGYNIYRKNQDSTNYIKVKSSVSDTAFSDSTLKDSGVYDYRITAVDTQNSEGVQSAGVLVDFKNRLNLATASAAFGMRRDHSCVAFNGNLWIIGGWNDSSQYNNDVWYSPDGITWTRSTGSPAFPKRKLHGSVVFDSKMWVIGGLSNNLGELNDVWNSGDGQTWKHADTLTDTVAFPRRYAQGCVVYNGKMWVIGGNGANGSLLTDVWYSSDGILWNEATPSAGFSPREGFKTIVFDNRIWVIGGAYGSTYMNDVWYSQDGIMWIKATASADFPSRNGHSLAVKDNLLWLIGGRGNSSDYSDIWYSANGVNWARLYGPSDFGTKFGHTSVVLDNRIWIVGQVANESRSDIWYLK